MRSPTEGGTPSGSTPSGDTPAGNVPANVAPAPDEAQRAALRALPLPLGTKIAYSSGMALDAVVNTSLNIFLLFYVTTACGLSPGLAGAAIALGLVVESALDPLIGLYSDNHRSRWGRRLPFMAAGLPLLLISYVLLFSLPDTDNHTLLFVLVAVLSASVRISLSVFNLPYLAVGAELSDDRIERERIIGTRFLLAIVASFTIIALGFGVFFSEPNALGERERYPAYAGTVAALMLVAGALALLATGRTLARQHAAATRRMTAKVLAAELAELLRSHSFRVLFGVALLLAAAQGVTQTLGLHAYTYFWRLDAKAVQFINLAIPGGMFLGVLIVLPLMKRLEDKTAALLGIAGVIAMQALPPLLKVVGLLTASGEALATILAVIALAGGVAATLAMLAVMAMITNAADEHEYLFGVRRESSYFAGWTLAFKIAGGLGTLLSGLALEAIAFPVNEIKQQGMDLALPERMTDALGLLFGPGAAILSIASLALLTRFRLDRARHAEIMAALRARTTSMEPKC